MAKKATKAARKPAHELMRERREREYRAELRRSVSHARAVTELTRQLDRAVDRNHRELRALAQKIADMNGDTIEPGTDAARRDALEQIPE